MNRKKRIEFCEKYYRFLEEIKNDSETVEWCRKYSVYERQEKNRVLYEMIHIFMKDAYDSGVVISEYGEIIEKSGLEEWNVASPSKEWAEKLTEEQLFAVIAWHFRRDHFINGSLIDDSIAEGYLLTLVKAVLKK